jgi:hypothetical protein
MSFVGTYDSVEDAEADYQLVKTLHSEARDRLVVVLSRSRPSGRGLLAGTTAGGAILGAVAGQAAAGMSATTSRNSVSSSTSTARSRR